ncbi:Cytochrome c oxidase assembly protein COX16 [Trinorchestia longiramus]|nr:Cytochrome c oxidase assembly protein COX16 [Trinorchestia longiramus]
MQTRKFINYGAPLIILVVGGSMGLKHFQQIRYDYRSQKRLDREEVRALGIEVKSLSDVTLDSEYKRVAELDLDTWENKRGPRPWEDNNPLYQEALQRAQQVKEGVVKTNSVVGKVAEVCNLKALKHWTNVKVRLVGRAVTSQFNEKSGASRDNSGESSKVNEVSDEPEELSEYPDTNHSFATPCPRQTSSPVSFHSQPTSLLLSSPEVYPIPHPNLPRTPESPLLSPAGQTTPSRGGNSKAQDNSAGKSGAEKSMDQSSEWNNSSFYAEAERVLQQDHNCDKPQSLLAECMAEARLHQASEKTDTELPASTGNFAILNSVKEPGGPHAILVSWIPILADLMLSRYAGNVTWQTSCYPGKLDT